MNPRVVVKRLMSESFYNHFFYYYLHVKQGIIPKKLNIKKPSTFNEKILWLKMKYRFPNASILADKILAKGFVKETVGSKYLIPDIAIYDNADQIDFDQLPESFVLKPNHGSGWIILCRDRAKLNVGESRKKLHEWLRTNYYRIGKEYQYRDIPPKILCEVYLENTQENPLLDYKFFCFSGKPTFVQVDLDRFTKHSRSFYDLEWNLMPFTIYHPQGTRKIPKPGRFDEMVEIAGKLSQGLIFSRIDLYLYKEQVFFGEITLHHGGGFEPVIPQKYAFELGQFIQLPMA